MIKCFLALAALFAPFVVSMPAATVTWGSPAAAVGPLEIDNSYSMVSAESGYSAPLTVNGVTFAALDDATNSILIEAASVHYQFGSFNSGDPVYDLLINNGFYTTTNTQPNNITLSDLTVGQAYQLQIWVGPWNGTYPTSFTAGNTVDMGNAHNVAKWVKGVFTADAATQTVTYHGTGGSGYGILAAVALSEIPAIPIPEPATYAILGGFAALGLSVCCKRRHRPRAA